MTDDDVNRTPLTSLDYNICDLQPCPFETGEHTITMQQPIPSTVPGGGYNVDVRVEDNAGSLWLCFGIVAEIAEISETVFH
eukprot:Nk52_evm2s154 gene=Nk52_evmTU2s154